MEPWSPIFGSDPPAPPSAKDIEITRIVASANLDDNCIHRPDQLAALVREAYEAGQRDPLPELGDLESGFTRTRRERCP